MQFEKYLYIKNFWFCIFSRISRKNEKTKIFSEIRPNLLIISQTYITFAEKVGDMYIRMKKHYCLECGLEIKYGRPDKKYCCPKCKDTYHNRISMDKRKYIRKVNEAIMKNYRILSSLLDENVKSIDMIDIVNLGYIPSILTSCTRRRGRMDDCACFDIKFKMSPTRIHCIEKIEKL